MNNVDLMEDTIARLIKRGGIYYDVPGATCREIMAYLIDNLQSCFTSNKNVPHFKNALLQAVMEREALISTGIENGIAFPHPRTPMLEEKENPFVVVAFPKTAPQDWTTPDNSKVHTIFLIVSKSPKQHLDVMSKISFLCRQNNFFKLLTERASKEKLIKAIEDIEDKWG